MAITRFSRPVATPPTVHSDTQAPATSDLRPKAGSTQDARSPVLLAGLSRRPASARLNAAPLTDAHVDPNRVSRPAQIIQPAKTAPAPVEHANILTRLKATFGRSTRSSPSDTSIFETSLQCGFVHEPNVLNAVYQGDKTGINGVCAGLSTLWINIHHAASDVSVITRLQTLASFEGMQHALIFQKLYVLNLDDLMRSSDIESVQSQARAQMDEMYGITSHPRPYKMTLSLAEMAATIASFDGYARFGYYRADMKGAHQMAMHRSAEDGMITFFDPNYGEFRFKTEKAVQFLHSLREKIGVESHIPLIWTLTKVQLDNTGKSTPLDGLVNRVKAEHASSSGEPTSAP